MCVCANSLVVVHISSLLVSSHVCVNAYFGLFLKGERRGGGGCKGERKVKTQILSTT